MTLRRMLLAGGGSSFVLPPVAFQFTSPPNGGWPALSGAFYAGGLTHFGWIDGSGNIEAATYDHATQTVGSIATIRASLGTDHHNSPDLLRRSSDGRIVAVYCAHDGPTIFRKISTNPDDISAWGSEASLDASLGGSQYTYPRLFELSSESKLYLTYRDVSGGAGRLCFSTSSDDGDTWAAQTVLFSVAGKASYTRAISNGVDRLDFVATDGSGGTTSAYHWYYEGGSYYKSDGTLISASPPFGTADVTKIYDGASAGVRYAAALITNGGLPVAGLVTQPGGSPPNDYRYLRWTGSAWDDHLIVGSGHDPGSPMFEGGFALATADLAYISRYVSAQWQVFRYTTSDDGATWSAMQLTSTTDPSFYPIPIRDYGSGLRALWLSGPTFTSQTNFSLAIYGGY